MIGKAKSNASLGKTLEYLEKENSILFYANNLSGDNIDDYRTQLEDLQQCYRGYGKQLLLHAILSPTIEDGQRLDKATWEKMAEMYLQEIKLFKDYMSVGFIHKDKEHTHAHLLISKININDYKLFQDSFIGKKTQHIADRIAQKFKLTRAMDIKRENLKKELSEKINKDINIKNKIRQSPSVNEEQPKGIRQKFKQELKKINEQKFQDTEAYFLALRKNGFKVIKHFDDSHNIRGYSVTKDGTMLNATTIAKEFSLRRLGLANDAVSRGQAIVANQNTSDGVLPLTNLKQRNTLYNYFKDCGIDRETVDKSGLQFILYKDHYYAALKNSNGGYAIVNPYTYDHIGKDDISIINNRQPDADVTICADIFDYLNLLQHSEQEKESLSNYIVLNNSYDAEMLKQQLNQLKPEQIHFLGSLTENNNQNTNHEQNILIQQVKAFMNILFSDEHLAPTVGDDFQKKKKKKLRPNW